MPATGPVNLKEKVRQLPDRPGVYLMKDRLGRIIYVGKAKSLKKRVSSFVGSDLEVLLRGLGVRHLVLTGVATSGVVLSTLRAAADLDFQITVLSDGCADGDPEVQNVLMTKVFPMQATVTTVADWTASL